MFLGIFPPANNFLSTLINWSCPNIYCVMQRISEVLISAPDIARNNMRGHSSKNNTLNSAARRRMEDRLFSRNDLVWYLVKREHFEGWSICPQRSMIRSRAIFPSWQSTDFSYQQISSRLDSVKMFSSLSQKMSHFGKATNSWNQMTRKKCLVDNLWLN